MVDITATALDYAIIIIYFVGILFVGTLFGRFTKNTNDFFFGGQKFAWWLVAMSCVATVVGSYSFIKYSAIGYTHGLSSTMTYLNDWFIVPFFVLGWLPILYFNRIQSIPEFFKRRFDEKTKIVTTFYILVFLVGYVGINLYTLGVALQPLLKINLYVIVVVVAVVGAVYMHAGGQTSVIMTDLLQGFILLAAGFLVLALGLGYLGGFERFIDGLPLAHRYPFADFNSPPEFNFVGVFWQDAAASSVAFYFMNQGTIMRFLSCRSTRDGRKAMYAIVLVLMPLAVLAIANTGWLGRAMTTHGMIPEVDDRDIFLVVASKITQPGVFGLILAALTAALMSTIDTLINAISAIFVNDIYRPYVKNDAPDAHYLKIARWTAIGATVVGIGLVPFFASYKSIYEVHGTFIASITPPVVTLILLSIFSKRITPAAAFWTLILGFILMTLATTVAPEMIEPFAHDIDSSRGYKYIRALFGIVVCVALAFGISFVTKPRAPEELDGLVIDSVHSARRRYKQTGALGGAAKQNAAGGVSGHLISEPDDRNYASPILLRGKAREMSPEYVVLSAADLEKLDARPGDLLFVEDERWWFGGLLSVQLRAARPHNETGVLHISDEALRAGSLSVDAGRRLRVQKIL